MELTAAELATITGGALVAGAPDARATSFVIDSRVVDAGRVLRRARRRTRRSRLRARRVRARRARRGGHRRPRPSRTPTGAAVVRVDDAFGALADLGRAARAALGRRRSSWASPARRARPAPRTSPRPRSHPSSRCTPARARTTTKPGCRSRCSAHRPTPRRWCSRWARVPTATSPPSARWRAPPSA